MGSFYRAHLYHEAPLLPFILRGLKKKKKTQPTTETQLNTTTSKFHTSHSFFIFFGEKVELNNVLVFSGLVLEVIYSLPEESDTEEAAVVVFKQQPGGHERTDQHESWIRSVRLTHFSRFSHTE